MNIRVYIIIHRETQWLRHFGASLISVRGVLGSTIVKVNVYIFSGKHLDHFHYCLPSQKESTLTSLSAKTQTTKFSSANFQKC